ncbi:Acetyltransferase (GNAT) family protein [Calidithermus terrae]|uniref:Acetyltransferase (GNAT) family protein n=1 Tax=Calidithermus terrae TaxID=1408545 RepID=A0A399EP87_9DEIN|nr:GNAT family N-acetyltransferase [Calidithermus terrae]RIH84302.1 Acetyltransferase (GNAT) family protein [Calidithermus terrae]
MTLEIRPIDLRQASEAEYLALHAFQNRMRAEAQPDDPPVPFEERMATLRNLPPVVRVWVWTVWEGGEVVAESSASYLDLPENRHLLEADVGVLPGHRRRGLARRLLAPVAELARQTGRTLLMGNTTARVPSGEAFMERLGAERGLESHTNQLLLAELDRELLGRWLREAPTADFELQFWEGPYAEADLEEVVRVLQVVMSDQPKDRLEMEDVKVTPQMLRQVEQMQLAAGGQRWTYFVREKATGRFAGYTEVTWNPHRPDLLQQQGTGVFPGFRGRGLGRWLKAAMIQKVLAERPGVSKIRTGNADSNAPMLKINRALGFKPYLSRTTWQVGLGEVRAYLG